MSEENLKKIKLPEELGITTDQWSILMEQLLLSYEMIENLRSGPVLELHIMQRNYLENYFGIKPEASLPDDLK